MVYPDRSEEIKVAGDVLKIDAQILKSSQFLLEWQGSEYYYYLSLTSGSEIKEEMQEVF